MQPQPSNKWKAITSRESSFKFHLPHNRNHPRKLQIPSCNYTDKCSSWRKTLFCPQHRALFKHSSCTHMLHVFEISPHSQTVAVEIVERNTTVNYTRHICLLPLKRQQLQSYPARAECRKWNTSYSPRVVCIFFFQLLLFVT